jgi:catechol 2,3-dioxygenase-like lactoylglutathione lyase family enzyme
MSARWRTCDDKRVTTNANDPGPRLVEWIALTIDCSDLNALADFYVDGLGASIRHRSDDSAWVVLDNLPIVLRSVPDYRPPTWPSPEVPLQSHFEIVVRDPDEAVSELVQHGATEIFRDPNDPHYIVMHDPAGQPFCLIRSSRARRP